LELFIAQTPVLHGVHDGQVYDGSGVRFGEPDGSHFKTSKPQ
jgi:hypothetical protein